MSTHDKHSFMPPDEPTAVYPIGNVGPNESPSASTPQPVASEPPEPPGLSPEILAEAGEGTPEGGFNPMIALALLGIPVVMGVGAVVLAGILLSMK